MKEIVNSVDHNSIDKIDHLIQDLCAKETSQTDYTGIRRLSNLWKIIKNESDYEVLEKVQHCFAQKEIPEQDDPPPPKPRDYEHAAFPHQPIILCYNVENSSAVNKTMANLEEIAQFDKNCNQQLTELLGAETVLRSQITTLEAREQAGIELMKEADEMWVSMEAAYKDKIKQSAGRQRELLKQLREVEASAAKWRKNKKDLEGQLRGINKTEIELTRKINLKQNDLKSMNKEIEDIKTRMQKTSAEIQAVAKSSAPKKRLNAETIAKIKKEIARLEAELDQANKKKMEKEKEGGTEIKQVRNNLQDLNKTLLQKKLETENLHVMREYLINEINLLKDSCQACKGRCTNRLKNIEDEIKRMDEAIENFKLQCTKCHKGVDTHDVRYLCTDCPRCLEARDCKVGENNQCTFDPAEDCVCELLKKKLLDNVFDNMFTILEKQTQSKAGKVVADKILACLKQSRNGKLNENTRTVLQDFILTNIKRNLNMTLVGGAVKTRCEMDDEMYNQLMKCLQHVNPTPIPRFKGEKTKKPCFRWNSGNVCNCPKGEKGGDMCICENAPPPPSGPDTCPPDAEYEPDVNICPHRPGKPCGAECGAHMPNRVYTDVSNAMPDPCQQASCSFGKNMRAAQCVLGGEALNQAEEHIASMKTLDGPIPRGVIDSQWDQPFWTKPDYFIQGQPSAPAPTPASTTSHHHSPKRSNKSHKSSQRRPHVRIADPMPTSNSSPKAIVVPKAPHSKKHVIKVEDERMRKDECCKKCRPSSSNQITEYATPVPSPEYSNTKVRNDERIERKSSYKQGNLATDKKQVKATESGLCMDCIKDLIDIHKVRYDKLCCMGSIPRPFQSPIKSDYQKFNSRGVLSKTIDKTVAEVFSDRSKEFEDQIFENNMNTKDIDKIKSSKPIEKTDIATQRVDSQYIIELTDTPSGSLGIELDVDVLDKLEKMAKDDPHLSVYIRKSMSGHYLLDMEPNDNINHIKLIPKVTPSGSLNLEVIKEDLVKLDIKPPINDLVKASSSILIDLLGKDRANVDTEKIDSTSLKTRKEHKSNFKQNTLREFPWERKEHRKSKEKRKQFDTDCLTEVILKSNKDLERFSACGKSKDDSSIEEDCQMELELLYSYTIGLFVNGENGVKAHIDAYVTKTRSGNVAIDIRNIKKIGDISNTSDNRPVLVTLSKSGKYNLYIGHQYENYRKKPNSILRKTSSEEFLVVFCSPVIKSSVSNLKTPPPVTDEFNEIYVQGLGKDVKLPFSFLRRTNSFNYDLVINKEFEKQRIECLKNTVDEYDKFYISLLKRKEGIVISFDEKIKKNAILVKTPSDNFKVLVNKTHFDDMRKKTEFKQILEKLPSLEQDIKMTNKNVKSVFALNKVIYNTPYQRFGMDSYVLRECDQSIDHSLIVKRTCSGQYYAVANETSKDTFVDDLKHYLKGRHDGRVPIIKVKSGELTLSLEETDNVNSQYATLHITPSENVIVVAGENCKENNIMKIKFNKKCDDVILKANVSKDITTMTKRIMFDKEAIYHEINDECGVSNLQSESYSSKRYDKYSDYFDDIDTIFYENLDLIPDELLTEGDKECLQYKFNHDISFVNDEISDTTSLCDKVTKDLNSNSMYSLQKQRFHELPSYLDYLPPQLPPFLNGKHFVVV